MFQLKHTTLVILCGWAGSGKTAVAEELKKMFGMHYADVDAIRKAMMGGPKNPEPKTPEELEEEAVAMLASYKFMAQSVDWHLKNNRSLIISATFSKTKYWNIFCPMLEMHDHARIKIIHCLPVNDTPKNVEEVLEKRKKMGYAAGVSTPKRYFEVKGRWDEPPRRFHKIETWGSENSVENSSTQAAEYILRED